MIFRIFNFIIVFTFLLIFTYSCSSADTEKKEVATTDTTISVSTDNIVTPKNLSPFTKDDAESLTGKYYNQENQLKKYAYYNSMAIGTINIDSNYHKDTILVTAHTTGRIWPNPNKDTTTSFFKQDLVLKVYRYKQIWWADKLQSPELVNAIPEPVKK